jgi:flagellar L-ring protein precursor FlgH
MSAQEKAGMRLIFLLMAVILAALIWAEFSWADSIWNASASRPNSLYSTTKGEFKIGDIITIMLVENVSATNSASLGTDKETQLEMQLNGFDDILGLTHLFGRPITVDPSFDVNATSEFEGGGSSRRSSVITGTISGQVTEILSNGNLRIEASQAMVINDEKNSVIVVGTVRPQDISPQNTILSTQVANVEIKYAGKGPLSNVQKRGIITEFLEFIWPF